MSKEYLVNVLKRFDAEFDSVSGGKVTTYLNPYSYLVLRKTRPDLASIDKVHCDGILLAMLLRLTGRRARRRSFDMTSMARNVFSDAECTRKRLYLVGGEPGVSSQAASLFRTEYPDLTIVGVESGFFEDINQRRHVISLIVDVAPDICVVGMGAPRQEEFLIELKDAGWRGEGYTCGGFFHQTVNGGVEYYPKWMDRLHLRWLYRMIDEPKLIRRYLVEYPKFIFVFSYDLMGYYLSGWSNRGDLEQ